MWCAESIFFAINNTCNLVVAQISFNKNCLISESACRDHGIVYDSAKVIESLNNIVKVDTCQEKCDNHPDCKYWEHNKTLKTCRLISSKTGVSFVGGSNIISGVSPCPKLTDNFSKDHNF